MKICYIYRSKNISFSIERVFAQIRKYTSPSIEQSELYCPRNNAQSPITYIKNMWATLGTKANIYHITGAVHYMALFYPRKRTLITVHDLTHITGVKGIKGFLLKTIFATLPFNWVKHIVAISECSKNEIVEKIGISPNKIDVIYDPAPDDFPYKAKEINLDKPRILCFSHLINKNLTRHIKALEGINCHLRILGRIPEQDRSLLKALNIEYSNAFDIPSEQIKKEYEDCDILLFASTSEGFGVPILEAQLTGRPVITSNIAPLTEVSGEDSAINVDPFDLESIRMGIKKLISERDLAETLIQKGLKNVERFSPANIAKQYENVYNKMLKKH